jgi:hypothetical protein
MVGPLHLRIMSCVIPMYNVFDSREAQTQLLLHNTLRKQYFDEGYRAYFELEKNPLIEGNPYIDGSRECFWYNAGWNTAADHTHESKNRR